MWPRSSMSAGPGPDAVRILAEDRRAPRQSGAEPRARRRGSFMEARAPTAPFSCVIDGQRRVRLRVPSRGASGAARLLRAGLRDLGLLGLGLGLALGELGKLLASTALGADADRRLLLLGLDDRQAYLAVLLRGGVDHDGCAGRDLFAQ